MKKQAMISLQGWQSSKILFVYCVVTLGDYISPKKTSKNNRYRTNNRLRPNRFIYVYRIDHIIDSFSKFPK